MAAVKISQKEADRLLNMLKHSLVSEINFPSKGDSTEFHVVGDQKKDLFAINIFRGKINSLKYNMGARIIKNGILLLELHINPSNIHINPDGEKITGSHWHLYSCLLYTSKELLTVLGMCAGSGTIGGMVS